MKESAVWKAFCCIHLIHAEASISTRIGYTYKHIHHMYRCRYMFKKQYIPFLHAAETRIYVANEALQLHGGCRYKPDMSDRSPRPDLALLPQTAAPVDSPQSGAYALNQLRP
jgi:hypothetical protein